MAYADHHVLALPFSLGLLLFKIMNARELFTGCQAAPANQVFVKSSATLLLIHLPLNLLYSF